MPICSVYFNALVNCMFVYFTALTRLLLMTMFIQFRKSCVFVLTSQRKYQSHIALDIKLDVFVYTVLDSSLDTYQFVNTRMIGYLKVLLLHPLQSNIRTSLLTIQFIKEIFYRSHF